MCPLICAVIDLLVARLDVDRDTKEFELELAGRRAGHCLNYPLPAGLEQLIACKPQIEATRKSEILGIFAVCLSRNPSVTPADGQHNAQPQR